MADRAERGEHQNINRASLVLAALAEAAEDGLRMTDVSEETGLGKATSHRLLAGLVQNGLAEQDPSTGRFYLGLRLVTWANAARKRFGLAPAASKSLKRLAKSTDDTVYLTLRSGDQAVCIDRREGAFPIKTLSLRVGDRRPLGIGSGSLAILAGLPEDECEDILASQAEARRPFGIDDASLRDSIRSTRDRGFAWIEGDIVPGMNAVAVAIRRDDGHAIAALSVTAISTRLQGGRRDFVVAQLRTEAERIEREASALLSNELMLRSA